jgi:hypothetical protein
MTSNAIGVAVLVPAVIIGKLIQRGREPVVAEAAVETAD